MNEQSQSVSAEEEYEVLPCPSCDTRYRIAASEGLQDEDPLHCSKCDTLFNRLKALEHMRSTGELPEEPYEEESSSEERGQDNPAEPAAEQLQGASEELEAQVTEEAPKEELSATAQSSEDALAQDFFEPIEETEENEELVEEVLESADEETPAGETDASLLEEDEFSIAVDELVAAASAHQDAPKQTLEEDLAQEVLESSESAPEEDIALDEEELEAESEEVPQEEAESVSVSAHSLLDDTPEVTAEEDFEYESFDDEEPQTSQAQENSTDEDTDLGEIEEEEVQQDLFLQPEDAAASPQESTLHDSAEPRIYQRDEFSIQEKESTFQLENEEAPAKEDPFDTANQFAVPGRARDRKLTEPYMEPFEPEIHKRPDIDEGPLPEDTAVYQSAGFTAPQVKSRSGFAALAIPTLALVVLFLASTVTPIVSVADILGKVKPEAFPLTPPDALQTEKLRFELLELPGSSQVRVIRGTLRNTSGEPVQNPTIEGALFDEEGNIIVRKIVSPKAQMGKAEMLSLNEESLKGILESKEKAAVRIQARESMPFSIAFFGKDAAQAKSFSARVYSVQ